MSKVNSLIFPTISVRLLSSGNSSLRVSLFTRRGFTATCRPYFMRIDAAIICKVVFIIITVCPAVRSTCFDDGLARLTGMTLYGGEKIVKGVKKLPSNRRVHG